MDRRQPIIVGVGQVTHRPGTAADAVEAATLMQQALETAFGDTGRPDSARTSLELLTVVQGMWRYPDPGRVVLDAVGASQARTALCAMGGNMAQALLIDAAEKITRGDLDVAAVLGAENLYSNRQLKKLDQKLTITGGDLPPAEPWGTMEGAASSADERALGWVLPIHIYPMFESALRATRGDSLDGHRRFVGELWSRFSEVAAVHPHSWLRSPLTADEIITPDAGNRMVAYPYTKRLVSNPSVDQAAAIVMMSVEKAEALGIPSDRWVYVHAAASGNDLYAFTERDRLDRSPAVATAAARCFELAETTVEEFEIIDLYSCFPAMVQITAAELGLDLDAQLTRTGGMSYFGGPYNSYCVHAVATVVDDVRATGLRGLVHGNGGNATKQNFVVYGADPAPAGFRHSNVQDEIDHGRRQVDLMYSGDATIEAYTVVHDGEGPTHALLTARNGDGHRVLARIDDAATAAAMEAEEAIGRTVAVAEQKGSLT